MWLFEWMLCQLISNFMWCCLIFSKKRVFQISSLAMVSCENEVPRLLPETWYSIPFTTACCAYGLFWSVFSLQHLILLHIYNFGIATFSGVFDWNLFRRPEQNRVSYFISTAGVEVTCSCRSGFAGDGFTCKGNIIQVRNTLQLFFLSELCMTLSLLVLLGWMSRSVTVLFLVCNVLEPKKSHNQWHCNFSWWDIDLK